MSVVWFFAGFLDLFHVDLADHPAIIFNQVAIMSMPRPGEYAQFKVARSSFNYAIKQVYGSIFQFKI